MEITKVNVYLLLFSSSKLVGGSSNKLLHKRFIDPDTDL
jgi:hypothetical protein